VTGRHAAGRSVRRGIARACIAVSAAALVAVVAVPGLRHHALAGGLGIVAAAVVSIACSLAYLRSSRGAKPPENSGDKPGPDGPGSGDEEGPGEYRGWLP
jgi:hypothetical protein